MSWELVHIVDDNGEVWEALYTLEQTQGLRADRLILASATRAQLPGSPAGAGLPSSRSTSTSVRPIGRPTEPGRASHSAELMPVTTAPSVEP